MPSKPRPTKKRTKAPRKGMPTTPRGKGAPGTGRKRPDAFLPPVVVAKATPPAPLGVEDLIRHFLSGRSARTMRAYQADLEDFRAFLGAPTVDDAAKDLMGRGQGGANALALEYRASMDAKGLSPATVGRRLAAIRSMIKLARLLGMVPWILDVRSPRLEVYRDTRGPGDDTFKAMMSIIVERKDHKGIRDVAILHLLHDLALRRGEVVGLDLEDMDRKEKTLAILGKGRTSKETLSLPNPTFSALESWIRVRPAGDGPLFVSLDPRTSGHRLTDQGVYKMIRALGEKVGVKVRPHGIRHLAVTKALDRTGGDVRKVQRFSRHRSIQTVLIYDDHRRDEGGDVAKLVAEEEAEDDSCSPTD